MHEEYVQSAKRALEEGRPQDAIHVLEPLADDGEDDPELLVCLGIAYVQAEMPENAVRILELAETMLEDHCVVKMFLGRALLALGKFSYAEDMLRESISLDPDEPEAWSDLSRILYRQRRYKEALRFLEDGVHRFPDDPSLMGLYALTLYRLGDYTAATEEWARVHRLRPDLMAAISNYAYLLLLQDRTFEASPFVGYAMTIDSGDYRALILQGEMRFRSGDLDAATESFLRVVEQDPENIEALSRLALLFHMARDCEMFRHYLSRAEMLLGRDPESWRGLCETYSRLGMPRRYVECLISWTQYDKGAAAPWVALAAEYDRQGLIERARNAWRVVFELRGYVKIRCPKCEDETRFPYDENLGFDVYQDTYCRSCGKTINMPRGLATY
ncbi:MAG: tetratricopeptide repeat protein [Candidatus Thorarchaeota archaeon]